MIQIYVKRSDLIRSGEITDKEDYNKILHSVIKDGIRDTLHCKPSGHILRGNTRLGIAEEVGIDYLPISLKAFIGLFVSSDGKKLKIRKSIIDYFVNTEENTDVFHMASHKVIVNKGVPSKHLVAAYNGTDVYSWYDQTVEDVVI